MAVLAIQRLRLRRWRSTQETLHVQILINIWPVDSKASASYLPIVTLMGSGMKQARVPSQRH